MKKDTTKSTILTISMGFLALFLIFSWDWAVFVSLAVGITGILSHMASRKIEWLWMKLASLLGYIVPNILLTLVFFLFLFPVSLLYKLFNKDALRLSKKHQTYFIDVKRAPEKESFEKTW